MTTATATITDSSLNYSKCKRDNKLIKEEKESLSNISIDHNIIPNNNNDLDIKANKQQYKGKENKKDELIKVFGDHNINIRNLDYLNSLLYNNNKSTSISIPTVGIPTKNNNRQKSLHKKKKNHMRHKSNVLESTKQIVSPSNQNNHNISNICPENHQSIQSDVSIAQPDHLNQHQTLSIQLNDTNPKSENNLEYHESSTTISNPDKKSIDTDSNNNNNNIITLTSYQNNQGKLTDCGIICNSDPITKRSFSLEEIKNKNEYMNSMVIHNSNDVDKPSENFQSPQKTTISVDNSKQESFLYHIDQYIDYFTKSQHSSSLRNGRYYQDNNHIINPNHNSINQIQKAYQKELLILQNENKLLAEHIEQLQYKLKDMHAINKKMSYELREYKTKIEDSNKNLRMLEQALVKVSQKKEEYKFKLVYTQDLLAKEKIDNENNLLALKKLLSTKMNNGNNFQYKEKNLKDHLNNGLHILVKKDDDNINKSRYRDKRLQEKEKYGSKLIIRNIAQDRLAYDLPDMFSPKMGTTSEDEEFTTRSIESSSSDLETSHDHEILKNSCNDDEIKYLKHRLLELIDYNDTHHYQSILTQDPKSSTRNNNKKNRIKFKSTHGFNHPDIRSKQGSSTISQMCQNMKIDTRYKNIQDDIDDDLCSTNENMNKSFSLYNSD